MNRLWFFLSCCKSLHRPASSPADHSAHGCTWQKKKITHTCRCRRTNNSRSNTRLKCCQMPNLLPAPPGSRRDVGFICCCRRFCAPFSWATERQWRRPQRAELNNASRCSLSAIHHSLVVVPQCNSYRQRKERHHYNLNILCVWTISDKLRHSMTPLRWDCVGD